MQIPSRYLRMPYVEKGMVVGLFGGSFNPPHEGHLLVSGIALKTLRLQQLWWLVTPGNPLKRGRDSAALGDRIAMSEKMAHDRRIKVTALEAGRGLSYTADTIADVKARNRGVHFVWIMGADNLAGFHLWQGWQKVMAMVPVAVIDRPGSSHAGMSAPMARQFAKARIDEGKAGHLARMKPPAWTFIHAQRSSLSSTAIRARNLIVNGP